MAADWTAFQMATALKTAVAARVTEYEPEVRVITYLPNPDEQLPDAIIIGFLSIDSEDNQRAHVGGDTWQEEVNLICRIQVTRSGAGQEKADLVRARVQALLAEVDEEVRDNLPTVGSWSRNGKVVDRDGATIAIEIQKVGAIRGVVEFAINYTARTSASA